MGKCPSVDEVEAWFMEEHQDELCVFSELGWLDNSGNFSDAAAQADLATLSPNVTAVLSEDNMQQCMEMVMEKMAEDKIVKKCVVNGKGNYSEEGQAGGAGHRHRRDPVLPPHVPGQLQGVRGSEGLRGSLLHSCSSRWINLIRTKYILSFHWLSVINKPQAK